MNNQTSSEHLFLTIPNVFTLSNLVFGIISITMSILGEYYYAFLAIFLAIICDGLDGFVARKLNAANDFGRELDSLCDEVSFGVAPAVMLITYTASQANMYLLYSVIVGAIFAAFGALRLARFNIYGSKEFFEGLAIPAAAFYAGLTFLCLRESDLLLVLIIYFIIASLMISSIIYPSAKTKMGVKAIIITIALGVILGVVFIVVARILTIIDIALWVLFFVITAYAFISPLIFKILKTKKS